jgi:hypothetical protein
MYNATVKFSYINDTEANSSKYFPEIVDKHTITIEAPAQDLNVHQHFELFKAFLRAMDFNEYSIMDGACRLAFNDSNDEKQMNKLMEEYELQDKQAYNDEDCRALEAEIRDLKAKLSRALDPENPNYTDDEIEAMTEEIIAEASKPSAQTLKDAEYNSWKGLVPGSPEAYDNGCKCPILDNQEMPQNRKWVNADCPIHGKVK